MKHLFLLFSFLVLPSAGVLLAQSSWQSATLVTTEGEEISGYVEDQRWRFRLRGLRFRESENKPAIRYPLERLQSFRAGTRRYLVRDVIVNTTPRDPRKLVSEELATREKTRVALLVLVEGAVALYEYTDEQSNKHYFVKKGTEELIYLEFGRYAMASTNSKTYYREANTFRGTLLRMLDECFRLRPEITKVNYRKEDLVRLFKNYYLCQGDAPRYAQEKEGGSWSVGPDFGMVRANPTYGEIEKPIYPFTDLFSWEPALGAHVKYRFGGPHGAVAIRFGAQFHRFDVQAAAPDPEEEDPDVSSTFQYNYAERSVHFQLGPEVVLVRSRYPLFLETMAEYHRILSYSESRFNRRVVNGQEELDGLFYNVPNQGALSLSAGVGILIGNARLSLRGSASRRKYPTYVLNLYRLGVMGSYDF